MQDLGFCHDKNKLFKEFDEIITLLKKGLNFEKSQFCKETSLTQFRQSNVDTLWKIWTVSKISF